MNVKTADFAATAPWDGITKKPDSFPSSPATMAASDAVDWSLLRWSASSGRWVPVTLMQLKRALAEA